MIAGGWWAGDRFVKCFCISEDNRGFITFSLALASMQIGDILCDLFPLAKMLIVRLY